MPDSEKWFSVPAGEVKSKPKVLIIDDNPQYAKIFELLSDKLGIRAYVVSSCSEAMDALNRESFDVILMDWFMPEIDGLLCTKKIRALEEKQGKRTPIIGVSGYMSANREKSLDGGMDDFLSVPFTIEDVRDTLNKWLRKEGQDPA